MTASTTSLSNVLTTFHVAYHGLEVFHVREVMDAGHLFAAESDADSDDEGKDEKNDCGELVFSPVLEYASISTFSPILKYRDSVTRKRLEAKVAFEVLAEPGSYKVGSARYPLPTAICQNYDIDCGIEWSTKEQGLTHVIALLIQLEGYFTS